MQKGLSFRTSSIKFRIIHIYTPAYIILQNVNNYEHSSDEYILNTWI